eukprot:TRINITY_DN3496_c0_g1_i17.p1 TRINITY_DN3496_c0_g1~~TRINITY_DN3496_c0_g1_i17.p1  ORF type:complete len:289 (+),score=82.18 TRINITY_DN3496_c0_g1_i17:75-869(+)
MCIRDSNVLIMMICFLVNVVQSLEYICTLILIGAKFFSEDRFLVYELITSVGYTILFTLTIEEVFWSYDQNFWQKLLIFRMMGFFRFIIHLKFFKRVYRTFYDLIPFLTRMLSFLSMVFYFYATLGMYLFGGGIHLKLDPKVLKVPEDYRYANFNDMGMGFYTLFQYLVLNNWTTHLDMHIQVFKKKEIRFFFVSFYLIACLLALNILIASIIEVLANRLQENALEQELKKIERKLTKDGPGRKVEMSQRQPANPPSESEVRAL